MVVHLFVVLAKEVAVFSAQLANPIHCKRLVKSPISIIS
jgi:hypothetical protein